MRNNGNFKEMCTHHLGFDSKEWEVHKFGGTSVASSSCFLSCARIVEEELGLISKSLSSGNSFTIDEIVNSINGGGGGKRIAVVVSAMGGKPKVTDLLLSTVRAAAKREEETVSSVLDRVREKHFTCIDELPLEKFQVKGEDASTLLKSRISQDIQDLRDILKTVSLMKWEAKRIMELVAGYGELWSTLILSTLLNARRRREGKGHYFAYIDARRVICLDEEAIQDGAVCWDISQQKLEAAYREEMEKLNSTEESLHLVVTGYVASNTEGVATTLQRDGSDYSAAIIGRLLRSDSITIWTDVDGVLSADPRRVPEAYVLPEVSFDEAMELAYFGAKVIHPKTMQPAIESDPPIPIFIRNTFNSSCKGTCIFDTSTTQTGDKCVCGFTSIDDMALVNVEGGGLIGVHGIAKRLFGALEEHRINVVLISQASSEHTITFAISASQSSVAKQAIEEEFSKEMRTNHITAVEVISPCSVIAAVGDGMHATAGVAGRFFSALGDAKINVLAISQGSSERNISAVVMMEESTRALRAVHAAFRLSHTAVRVGIVGTPDLGYSLLELLESRRSMLRSTFEIDVQVHAVMLDDTHKNIISLKDNNANNSITTLAYDTATNKSEVEESLLEALDMRTRDLEEAPRVHLLEGGFEEFASCVQSFDCAHNIIIDCTLDEEVAKYHPRWLRDGIHVITGNPMGISGSRELRTSLNKAQLSSGKNSPKYLTETTAGGALPVLATLRSLLNSGDKIRRISGILSVSMSYIFHRIAPPPGLAQSFAFDKSISHGAIEGSLYMTSKLPAQQGRCSFSTAVREAIALGLMEEDPLKDLSNEYTARVLIVLAKELGLDAGYDVEKIQLTSDMLMVDVEERHEGEKTVAVKIPLKNVTKYEDIADQLDEQMHDRVVSAAQKGCVPRHISSIDVKTGQILIEIIDVPCNHIYAITPPSVEIVRFYTKTHNRYPLVIQGPTAGDESVARGLLAELLSLMQTKVGVRCGVLTHTSSSAFLA